MPVSIVTDNPLFGELLKSECQKRSMEVEGVYSTCHAVERLSPGGILLVHVRRDDVTLQKEIMTLKSQFGKFRALFLLWSGLSPEMLSVLRSLGGTLISEAEAKEALVSALTLTELGYQILTVSGQPEPDPEPPRQEPAQVSQVVKATPDPHLSAREMTIVGHLVEGLSNKGIANKLGITETTVKVHLRSAYRKIGVSNRTQAAIWLSQEGAARPVGSVSP